MRVQLRGLSGDTSLNGQCGSPARCDSARLAELNDALAAATAKVSEEKARRAIANEGESKCVVCLEAARDVVFMPCFHVVSCWNCGLRVSECPVCRVAIQQKRRVYS